MEAGGTWQVAQKGEVVQQLPGGSGEAKGGSCLASGEVGGQRDEGLASEYHKEIAMRTDNMPILHHL